MNVVGESVFTWRHAGLMKNIDTSQSVLSKHQIHGMDKLKNCIFNLMEINGIDHHKSTSNKKLFMFIFFENFLFTLFSSSQCLFVHLFPFSRQLFTLNQRNTKGLRIRVLLRILILREKYICVKDYVPNVSES